MEAVYWFIDLLIPLIMVFFGSWFMKMPPQDINTMVGYRTQRAMQSQEAWDFAQIAAGKYYINFGLPLLLAVILCKLFLPKFLSVGLMTLVYMGVGMVLLILPIFLIERQLKEKFPDTANKK